MFTIAVSEFRLKNGVIQKGYLEDYGDDLGFCERFSIYLVASKISTDEKKKREVEDGLIPIELCYGGYLSDVKVYVDGGGGDANHWALKHTCFELGYFWHYYFNLLT